MKKSALMISLLISTSAFAQFKPKPTVELRPREVRIEESLRQAERNKEILEGKRSKTLLERAEDLANYFEALAQKIGLRFISTKQVKTLVNFSLFSNTKNTEQNIKAIIDRSLSKNEYVRQIGFAQFDILFASSYIVDRMTSNHTEFQALKADRELILHMAANSNWGQIGRISQALKQGKPVEEIRELSIRMGLNPNEVSSN